MADTNNYNIHETLSMFTSGLDMDTTYEFRKQDTYNNALNLRLSSDTNTYGSLIPIDGLGYIKNNA